MNVEAPEAALPDLLRRLQPGETDVDTFVGIEQEFEVWHGPERVDFRELIHSLPIEGLRIDPGDTNAYRLPSGMALTCDEAEAELASPPIPLGSGFASLAADYADAARRTLESLLPPGHAVRGYSTHVSVSVPGSPDIDLAARYAASYGPLFGVLIDRAESNGIYVRPRPGRLELCGEFVEGQRLAAAVAFAAATVTAAREGRFAAALDIELLPCRERFGFRVHRTWPGFDLYAAGRTARLSLADGGTRELQQLLTDAWASARPSLAARVAEDDLAEIDAIVAGERPLGIEATDAEPRVPARNVLPTSGRSSPLPSLGEGVGG